MKEFKLPKGSRKIVPVKKEIGHWVKMTYDAQLIFRGVQWLRVKDGMSGNADREDWVANLGGVCISVHDYCFRAPYWGHESHRAKDIFGAMDIQLKEGLQQAENTQKERLKEAAILKSTIEKLRSALE